MSQRPLFPYSVGPTGGFKRAYCLHAAPELADRREAPGHAYADANATCDVVFDALHRLLFSTPYWNAAPKWTAAEQVCIDAITFDSQVRSGGSAGWLHNGYARRATDAQHALTSIGAHYASKLAKQAIRALPAKIRAALVAQNYAIVDEYTVGMRFSRRLDRGARWWRVIRSAAANRTDRQNAPHLCGDTTGNSSTDVSGPPR